MADPQDVPRPLGVGSSDLADRLRALRSDARVGAAVLVCVAIAAGVAWFRAGTAPSASASASASGSASTSTSPRASRSRSAPTDDQAPTTSAATDASSTTVGAIVVDVVGAVRVAGVVSLPVSARVIDAIRAAGGALAAADLSRLNLAAKLTDGARVAVPRAGQPPPALDPGAMGGSVDPPAGGPDPSGAGPTAPIDVNTATVEQLEALPGIGPTLAGAIVQERERNGPFRNVDDLTRVPGIGDGRLAQLRSHVAV